MQDPVGADNEISSFAITGRSGRTGFLQRLAVDPRYQRTGIGRSLVADALQWSKRWFVNELLVNTQIGNTGAQKLYESMGFSKKSDGLAVLKWNAEIHEIPSIVDLIVIDIGGLDSGRDIRRC